MKKAIPLIMALMTLGTSKPVIIEPQTRYFCNVVIAPYEVGQPLSFSYSYHSYKTENASIKAYITCGGYTNVAIYTRPSARIMMTLTDWVTISEGFLIAQNAVVKLTATGTGFSSSKQMNLSAISHAVIDPSVLTNGTYVATGKAAVLSLEGGLTYSAETLQFSGFQSLYETSSYHRLALPDLTLDYTNAFEPLTSTSLDAELYLSDPKGLFFRLPFDATYQARHLNGQLVKKDDGLFHFSITDSLYVDPQTLTMSTLPDAGYTATSFVYFPKNHFSELKTMSGRIKIAPFGMNDLTIDFRFEHETQWAFFGDCASASYCLVVDNDSIDLGYDYTEEGDTHA